ncbi:PQQ-dependent sugar dehydrogenase [Sphingobacterium faecale]|uniref:PQQ-dependent sugar dehydrogenase n=1 Tax=Sphingobacterium faecale TaxID=2803775 RepID=A0ABS1R3H9_9SPHI|nr:PQQ-dependent sugar dehydrogenase [Sphingobacterium faecale]MBL1409266.1 PQQ-dependent sugar dehydrogenase [Sphingobacterium faecale]
MRVLTLISVVVISSCRNHKDKEIIDFIKVSDQTYLSVTEVASNLDVPWDMQYSPSTNSIFFTQIKGKVAELNLETNSIKVIYEVPNVYHQRTLGLLGLAIHPNFAINPYLYICYTTKEQDSVFSELRRLELKNGQVIASKLLLKIDGGTGHNGSRLAFDNSHKLYWATGDIHSLTHAQDSTTLNGKILRMNDDGGIPHDNPIRGSYVYAWGFRNMQGMTFTANGNLLTSEHGDAIEDEINWIRPLSNYGWIDIEGYHDTPKELAIASKSLRTEPIKAWTPVIAPAALKYYSFTQIPEWNNRLLLGTLKDQSLRILKLNVNQNQIIEEDIFLKDKYGRIRAITVDKKGNVYIATSNRDWKPQTDFPLKTDDRILKLSRIEYTPRNFLSKEKISNGQKMDAKALYQSYCASCHKADGNGTPGSFPSLLKSSAMKDSKKLIHIVLNGLKTTEGDDTQVYDLPMPSFSFLKDEEVASIVNYIRTRLINSTQTIDANMVGDIRNQE